MNYLSIPNWQDKQHYRDRDPKWIKLYRDLLEDYEFNRLSETDQLHLVKIWLLAAKLSNRIPADARWIRQRISSDTDPNLDGFLEDGWLVEFTALGDPVQSCTENGATPVSTRYQVASPEREEEEEEEREVATPELPSPGKENPLESFPTLSRAYEGILTALHKRHPSAKIPDPGTATDREWRNTLRLLVTADGYSERDVVDCVVALFEGRLDKADFSWADQVQSLVTLRRRRIKGDQHKFMKIHSVWLKRRSGGERNRDYTADLPAEPFEVRHARRKLREAEESGDMAEAAIWREKLNAAQGGE